MREYGEGEFWRVVRTGWQVEQGEGIAVAVEALGLDRGESRGAG